MAFKWHILLGAIIFFLGIGGILFYDRYYVPVILAEDVIKVKVDLDQEFISKNYKLQKDDLYIDKVPSQHVPKDYVLSIEQAMDKFLNVDITDGTILTETMIDVDDLMPSQNEGIFAIPKEAIFAINGTLRRRDVVDVYLIQDPKNVSTADRTSIPANQDKFLEKVTVAYVRTDNNNDVRDTEEGHTTHRITSTGQVAYPEIILTDEQGSKLKNRIEQGYMLWIVRVK